MAGAPHIATTMKKSIVPVVVLWLGIFCVWPQALASSQDEAAVVTSFKDVVQRVDEYFLASPVVLSTDNYPLSPSGTINYLLKFEKVGASSFDVVKTTSLISPFTAYIVLRLAATSNARFGDIKTPGGIRYREYDGFQNVEAALRARTFSSCSNDPRDDVTKRCVGNARLHFAFQDNAWVFKGADLPEDSRIRDGQTARVLDKTFRENPEWQQVLSGKK
jgi:hypothetical protein